MPRIARKYLTGKVFHIMVQGLNKEYIFKKDQYKIKYKKLLQECLERENIKIIAYCIMNNHVHLLIYTENINRVSRFMQRVNTKYALYYNKMTNRVGYVFRDRFNVQVIEDEEHLKNCIVYIHQNPIKASIVKRVEEYRFSSYNEYIGNPKLISKDIINLIFGTDNAEKLSDIIYFLHVKNVYSNFIEVAEDIDYHKIIEHYRENGLKDRQIIVKLKDDYKLSMRSLEKIMKLSRYSINKMLK